MCKNIQADTGKKVNVGTNIPDLKQALKILMKCVVLVHEIASPPSEDTRRNWLLKTKKRALRT
jgi:hypothetical protein